MPPGLLPSCTLTFGIAMMGLPKWPLRAATETIFHLEMPPLHLQGPIRHKLLLNR